MKLSPNLLSSLQKLRLFQGLSPRQIQRVFASCSQETFEPGARLTESGAESDRMFIIVSGAVEIRSARDLLLAREKAVTTVGETGMLSGEVRSATAIVTEAVNALVIGRRPLMQVMQDDATLAIRLYRNAMVLVRGKLIAADQRIESMIQGEEPE